MLQNHLVNPSGAMRREKLEENFGNCNALTRFLLPIVTLLTLASILSTIFWSEELDIEVLIYKAITTAAEPFVVFYVIKYLSKIVFHLFGITDDVDEKTQVVSLQLMILYFFVTLLCTIFPDPLMLNCIYIYAFFMMWYIAGEYLDIADSKRMKFMFAEIVVCAVAYIIFPLLLGTLTPKHP